MNAVVVVRGRFTGGGGKNNTGHLDERSVTVLQNTVGIKDMKMAF